MATPDDDAADSTNEAPTLDQLAKMLTDPMPYHRRATADKLKILAAEEALEVLLAAPHEIDRNINYEVIDALATFDSAGVPRLIAMAKNLSRSESVRASCLGGTGWPW